MTLRIDRSADSELRGQEPGSRLDRCRFAVEPMLLCCFHHQKDAVIFMRTLGRKGIDTLQYAAQEVVGFSDRERLTASARRSLPYSSPFAAFSMERRLFEREGRVRRQRVEKCLILCGVFGFVQKFQNADARTQIVTGLHGPWRNTIFSIVRDGARLRANARRARRWSRTAGGR